MLEGQAQVSLRSYEARETLHVHDWHQLVLPVEGAQAVDFGHTDGTLAVGRGVLVTSGQPHRFRGLGENSFVVLDIPDRGARAQGLPDAVRRRATAMPFFAVDDGLRRLTGYVAHELAGGASTRRRRPTSLASSSTRSPAGSARARFRPPSAGRST